MTHVLVPWHDVEVGGNELIFQWQLEVFVKSTVSPFLTKRYIYTIFNVYRQNVEAFISKYQGNKIRFY